jgi:hypothetical protein
LPLFIENPRRGILVVTYPGGHVKREAHIPFGPRYRLDVRTFSVLLKDTRSRRAAASGAGGP